MSGATSTSPCLVPPSWLFDDTAHVSSDTASGVSGAPTVQISQDEYDKLRKLEFSQQVSSSMDAYIVSPHRPWILNSGVSSHMTCTKEKFIFLHLFNKFPPVNIVDDTQSHVLGDEVVQTTPSLNLTSVLCVPKFSVSFLSISQFIKQNNYSITFFSS